MTAGLAVRRAVDRLFARLDERLAETPRLKER